MLTRDAQASGEARRGWSKAPLLLSGLGGLGPGVEAAEKAPAERMR
jgi:hypothetical protein